MGVQSYPGRSPQGSTGYSLASDLTDTYGVRVSVVPVDLATDAGIAAVEQAIASTDDLGILVINAGFGMRLLPVRGDINRHLT